MDTAFVIGFGLVLTGSLFTIVCCIVSMVAPCQKGEVLFDFLSWPHHKSRTRKRVY
jgi:hypothetical protein